MAWRYEEFNLRRRERRPLQMHRRNLWHVAIFLARPSILGRGWADIDTHRHEGHLKEDIDKDLPHLMF